MLNQTLNKLANVTNRRANKVYTNENDENDNASDEDSDNNSQSNANANKNTIFYAMKNMLSVPVNEELPANLILDYDCSDKIIELPPHSGFDITSELIDYLKLGVVCGR